VGIGFLQINTTTSGGALPVTDALVQINSIDGTPLYMTMTDENGNTQVFPITAPDKSLTLNPNYNQPAYSGVNVVVSAPGYITQHINGVQIIDTETAILPLNMEPLAQGQASGDNFIDIPPIGLLLPQNVTPEGPPETPATARVLSEVLIPDYITVHLGVPTDATARNLRVRFSDYIKNVASSEIYSTWPNNSLTANIHAIVSFALNRVYTEWYRSRGYNFDITNNTNYDQYFREGAMIYESISRIVDEIFNVYIHRIGFANPLFALFCAGASGTCENGGMSQWGTVTLANSGYNPLQILQNSYGNNIDLSASDNIGGITATYPGTPLSTGSSGPDVQRIQNFLNRIRINYPAIPRIEDPNGVFGADTATAVQTFQSINALTQDGIVGPATWNKITQVYVAVTKLAELNGEGTRVSIGTTPPSSVLSVGSRGNDVLELQFILNTIAASYPEVPDVIQDSLFDTRTRDSVLAFQKTFGLPQDGVVGPATWAKLYSVYQGIRDNVKVPPVEIPTTPPPTLPYPGTALGLGSTGDNVRIIQEYLNVIRRMYPNIPLLTVNGIFDTGTQAAVIAFQNQFLLTPDGFVGPVTWAKIMEQHAIAIGTPTQPIPTPNYFFYTVHAGDSLYNIALHFGTTVDAIKSLNGLTSDIITEGQVLKIPNEPTPPSYFNYTVVAGDTLFLLAQRFGTTVQAIMELNGLTSTNLSIGQVLKIPGQAPTPPSYFNYTVVAGDTLFRLAQRFGTTVQAIIQLNGLTSTNLYIGQVLKIPSGTTPPPALGKTVVLDPGHGGSALGAVNGNRLEKNDNLRLAIAVHDILVARGVNVVMTRITDVDVSLDERSNISNRNNADIFVSFHRDASDNPAANGVGTFIYTAAPARTAGYAFNVSDNIVNVGVQNNRGVIRANYAVLRNTVAPAMLLEMGFITNTRDNQLFDANFSAYANAIANGIITSLTQGQTSYRLYTVVPGDNLPSIASRFGTTTQAIMSLNKLTSANITDGQVLRIP
jgi:N-acetylmuramoyl-L-alanine amidase